MATAQVEDERGRVAFEGTFKLMDKAEAVELVRKAQRAGVPVAIILAFLDVIELQASLTEPVAVSAKTADYSD